MRKDYYKVDLAKRHEENQKFWTRLDMIGYLTPFVALIVAIAATLLIAYFS